MELELIYITLGGLALGVLVSLVAGINSKPTATKYIYTIFGISSGDLITNILLFTVGAGLAGLAGLSVLIRDGQYPNSKPWYFAIETLLMGFLPAAVLPIMTVFRGYGLNADTAMEFALLAVKFGVLHVLMQYSGFYSTIFPPA